MKITIGTQNKVKIEALKESIKAYDFLKDAEIIPKEVDSGINNQPKNFNEIITGAKNRAKAAFDDSLSFGIESGITPVPHTKSGHLEFTCCVIYDGKDFHIGMSSGFDMPPKIMQLLHQGMDLTQASFKAGFTEKENIGEEEGIVGILTKGIVTRKDYTMYAIRMALIHLQNREHY
jgi:inosine/xanthosine triphosphatase